MQSTDKDMSSMYATAPFILVNSVHNLLECSRGCFYPQKEDVYTGIDPDVC